MRTLLASIGTAANVDANVMLGITNNLDQLVDCALDGRVRPAHTGISPRR